MIKLLQALPLEFSPFFKHLPILNPTYLFSAIEKQDSVIRIVLLPTFDLALCQS